MSTDLLIATLPLPHSQRGPRYAKSIITLRRLEIGEHRRVGDYWLSYGRDLEPVEPEYISRWFPWRNRVKKTHCPHYRIVRLSEITDIK